MDINRENSGNIRPSHYKMTIKGEECEARDVMKAVMPESEYKGFLYGNCIKYILRAYRKNGTEDLKKAGQYIQWLIEEREAE